MINKFLIYYILNYNNKYIIPFLLFKILSQFETLIVA